MGSSEYWPVPCRMPKRRFSNSTRYFLLLGPIISFFSVVVYRLISTFCSLILCLASRTSHHHCTVTGQTPEEREENASHHNKTNYFYIYHQQFKATLPLTASPKSKLFVHRFFSRIGYLIHVLVRTHIFSSNQPISVFFVLS